MKETKQLRFLDVNSKGKTTYNSSQISLQMKLDGRRLSQISNQNLTTRNSSKMLQNSSLPSTPRMQTKQKNNSDMNIQELIQLKYMKDQQEIVYQQTSSCSCNCKRCQKQIDSWKVKMAKLSKQLVFMKQILTYKEIGIEKRDIMITKYIQQLTQLNQDITHLKIQLQRSDNDNTHSYQEKVNQKFDSGFTHSQTQQAVASGQINNQTINEYDPSSKLLSQNLTTINDEEKVIKPMISKFQTDTDKTQQEIDQNEDEDNLENLDKLIEKPSYRFQSLMPIQTQGFQNPNQVSSPSSPMKSPGKRRNTKSMTILKEGISPLRRSVEKQKSIKQDNGREIEVESPTTQQFSQYSSYYDSRIMHSVTQTQGFYEDSTLFQDQRGKFVLLENEDEMSAVYKKLGFLMNIFMNEDRSFLDRINQMNLRQQKELGKLNFACIEDMKRFYLMAIKFKQLLSFTKDASTSLNFKDSFDKILTTTCSFIKCQTTSLFLVDEIRQELWTVAAADGKTIRIPIQAGIVGYCVQYDCIVNVKDAYQDSRFNKKIDLLTGFQTRNILCVPIRDTNDRVIGCLEGINQIDGIFSRYDEDLITIMSHHVSGILRNSLLVEKIQSERDVLKIMIKTGIQLFEYTDITHVLINGEIRLRDVLGSSNCIIYLVQDMIGDDKYTLKRIVNNKDIQINNEGQGIVGWCVSTKNYIEEHHPYENKHFRPSVDIDTHLPLITAPVIDSNGHVIGVIQSENMKVFLDKTLGKGEINKQREVITTYANIIAACIEKAYQFQQRIEQQKKILLERHIREDKKHAHTLILHSTANIEK